MARLPRLTLPGHPHHLIQRGNNRQSIFLDDADYRQMLAILADQARQAAVAVHSYVLMDTHFHLLATPQTEQGMPTLMQAVGRRYVRYFNDRHRRTGTLWEGRYRSTLLEAQCYLLPCMVYVDSNPVRAGLVEQAVDYPWSSCRHYAGQLPDRLVTPHPMYWTLGNTPFAREQAYQSLVSEGITEETRRLVTDRTLHGWALGGAQYLQALELGGVRRPGPRPAGRPPKKVVSPVLGGAR